MQVLPLLLVGSVVSTLAQYNQDVAIQFAKIAGAAYCLPDQVKHWNCPHCTEDVTSVQLCTAPSKDKTQAIVGRWKDGCVVSFEGTESVGSEIADIELYTFEPSPMLREICDNCSVHAGYLDVWTNLHPCVITSLHSIGCSEKAGSPIRVTGHSLGAAVTAIAMMMLERNGFNITEAYNFGMPRTGDASFAANFTATFSGKFWRVTHHKDPIVQVPPDQWGPISWRYRHVEPEIFYDGNLSQGYKMCTDSHDHNCSAQYWDFNWDFTCADHMTYVGVQMGHGPCGYQMTTII